MKYQLVIQFPEGLMGNVDQIIEIEEVLQNNLLTSSVDGHDFGSGQMNIFILTDAPIDDFTIIKNILSQEINIFVNMKAAYRDIKDEKFIFLWPQGLQEFRVI